MTCINTFTPIYTYIYILAYIAVVCRPADWLKRAAPSALPSLKRVVRLYVCNRTSRLPLAARRHTPRSHTRFYHLSDIVAFTVVGGSCCWPHTLCTAFGLLLLCLRNVVQVVVGRDCHAATLLLLLLLW